MTMICPDTNHVRNPVHQEQPARSEEFWTRYLGAVFRVLEANLMQELDEQTVRCKRDCLCHSQVTFYNLMAT